MSGSKHGWKSTSNPLHELQIVRISRFLSFQFPNSFRPESRLRKINVEFVCTGSIRVVYVKSWIWMPRLLSTDGILVPQRRISELQERQTLQREAEVTARAQIDVLNGVLNATEEYPTPIRGSSGQSHSSKGQPLTMCLYRRVQPDAY